MSSPTSCPSTGGYVMGKNVGSTASLPGLKSWPYHFSEPPFHPLCNGDDSNSTYCLELFVYSLSRPVLSEHHHVSDTVLSTEGSEVNKSENPALPGPHTSGGDRQCAI